MDKEKLPRHVAIIMDGNGRWAKKRLLPRAAGHKAGVEALARTVEECSKRGVEVLSVYAFSSENWNRDPAEVGSLMELMTVGFAKYVPQLDRNNIRLVIAGDLGRFDPARRRSLEESVAKLSGNTGMTLCVCLSYGGRQEIVRAVNDLIASGAKNVTEEDISSRLYTAGLPDPDIVIRTSGEYRVSNFLLWQSAYAEYYFTDVLWPDFDEKELEKAFDAYSKRERRFGR